VKLHPLPVRLLRHPDLPADGARAERHSRLHRPQLRLAHHLSLLSDRDVEAEVQPVHRPVLRRILAVLHPARRGRKAVLMARRDHRPGPLLNRPVAVVNPNAVAARAATTSTDGKADSGSRFAKNPAIQLLAGLALSRK
jgi:hypothetical protein